MTIIMNPEDRVNCYFCNSEEEYDQRVNYESVTLYDGKNSGTMTVFICPKCRKNILENSVAKAFRSRFVRAGQTGWELKEEEDDITL